LETELIEKEALEVSAFRALKLLLRSSFFFSSTFNVFCSHHNIFVQSFCKYSDYSLYFWRGEISAPKWTAFHYENYTIFAAVGQLKSALEATASRALRF
jgi:hypothetical protein